MAWSQKFRDAKRRLKQGFLEKVGVAESSLDHDFEEQQTKRLVAVEQSLQRMNNAAHKYLSSMKEGCAGGAEFSMYLCASMQEAAAMGRGVADATGAKQLLRNSLTIQKTLMGAVEAEFNKRVLRPLGDALLQIAQVRDLFSQRRAAVQDFDSYLRQVDSLNKRIGGDKQAIQAAEAKLEGARLQVQQLSESISELLDLLEVSRAAMLEEQATVMAACQAHFYRRCSELSQPMLVNFPDSPLIMAELAGTLFVLDEAAAAPQESAAAPASRRRPVSVALRHMPTMEIGAGDTQHRASRRTSVSVVSHLHGPTNIGGRPMSVSIAEPSRHSAVSDQPFGAQLAHRNKFTTSDFQVLHGAVQFQGTQQPLVGSSHGTLPSPSSGPLPVPASAPLPPPMSLEVAPASPTAAAAAGATPSVRPMSTPVLPSAPPPPPPVPSSKPPSLPTGASSSSLPLPPVPSFKPPPVPTSAPPAVPMTATALQAGTKQMVRPRAYSSSSEEDSGDESNAPKVAIATYDFVPEEEGEIPLREGDEVLVIHQDTSGWWRGTCRGKTGLFPHNHVQFR